jgi:hypothetical protein
MLQCTRVAIALSDFLEFLNRPMCGVGGMLVAAQASAQRVGSHMLHHCSVGANAAECALLLRVCRAVQCVVTGRRTFTATNSALCAGFWEFLGSTAGTVHT